MKKLVLIYVILMIFLLPVILGASASEDLQGKIEKAAHYAAQYHSGNENYAEYTSNINRVEEEINTILIFSEVKEVEESLGESNEETAWVATHGNDEVKLEKPVPVWTNKIIFDGKEQLKYDLTPTADESNKVSYKIEFTTDFVQSKPLIDIKNEISEIETLAKTYGLDSSVQNANSLAEKTVNTENLFKEYIKLSPIENCEEVIADILGEETKVSEIEVVTKEFEIEKKGDTSVIAKLEICDNCNGQNTNNFININMRIETNGNPVSFIQEELSLASFENLDSNGYKRALIDSNKILNELLEGGNYQSAYRIMKRMEGINRLWDKKANEGNEKEKLVNFVDRNQFLHSLFEGFPVKTSSTEQILFEKTLVQEVKNNSGEICDNKIDDNQNEVIDCADSLCAGKVCGTQVITTTDGNQTVEELREMYCILGICQLKSQTEEKNESVCGNKICEDGESESCSKDCVACQEYPEIECLGKVISKGEDENGCPLEPVCLEEKKSCSTSQDCEQALCGNTECIEGSCKTTELLECRESVCNDGEEKSQTCDSGEKIVIERCNNGKWLATGLECSVSLTGPTQDIKKISNACKIASDCGEGNVCMNGRCETLSKKKDSATIITKTDSQGVSGVSFTGEIIKLTTEVLTGVVPDPTNPEALETPQDYKRPSRANGDRSSFLTGVSRTENEGGIATQPSQETGSTQAETENFVDLSDKESEVFVANGVCIKNNKGVTAILSFEGGGENFALVSQLEKRYERDGTETYCRWKLENLLRERTELEKSFTQEFVTKFFEEELPNYADTWENAHKTILDLNQQNIKNQIETAQMMECLGIKKLSEYNLINIDYENPLYGSLKYEEKISTARLSGMKEEVEIITPSIKEFVIFPPKDYIKRDLIKNMNEGTFPGSIKSSAERKASGGLTPDEKTKVKENSELMQMIKSATSNYPDGNLDTQITVIDENGNVVYNIYVRLNEKEIIKAQPLSPEKTPTKNAEVVIGFDEFYSILRDAKERTYRQDAPWEGNGIAPIEIIKSAVDWIDTQIKLRSLMGSIKITPERSESELKSLFKEILFIIAEEELEKTTVSSVREYQTVWNPKGASKRFAVG